MLAKCFNPQNFEEMMTAVDPPTTNSEDNFRTACENAGLQDAEITWLWTYLKHCNASVYGPCPDVAVSGW
jgi:hypothetical protein